MLSRRLEELSQQDDHNSIAELVVTALGTRGSYYICWKTPVGRYKQDSHGLPSGLQDWLFEPTRAHSRDYTTLQVILGPGDDDYFASDSNGKVEYKAPEPSVQLLRRASTFASFDQGSAAAYKRLSMSPVAEDLPSGARARRSSTYSSPGSTDSPRASLVGRRMSPSVALTGEPNRQSSIAVIPFRIQLAGIQQRRPQSEDRDNCTIDDAYEKTSIDSTGPPSRRHFHTYVDAGVQTDPPMWSQPQDPDLSQGYQKHNRDWSRVSAASTLVDDYTSESDAKPHDISAYAMNHPEEASLLFKQALANPVRMGRMQDYFRGTTYALGDALSFGDSW
ncbi:hypothetical protein BX600DRAFT_303437 [Xylariales sp. PMI_506]|nr:hypothetical protein BX600DRAFT_303437 [Xylariales sp. PMI_506]